jgi:hypothetical protein
MNKYKQETRMNYRLSPSLREKIQVKDWMEHLRKNSWEMELLITGFVLVGLFKVHGLLVNLRYDFCPRLPTPSAPTSSA